MLPPGAIFELKIHQNAFVASSRTPLRELSTLTRPIAGFQGAASWQGNRKEERRGE